MLQGKAYEGYLIFNESRSTYLSNFNWWNQTVNQWDLHPVQLHKASPLPKPPTLTEETTTTDQHGAAYLCQWSTSPHSSCW